MGAAEMGRSDIVRWGIALAIAAFGALCHDPNSSFPWLVLTSVLYSVPLAAQCVPRTWVQVYGITIGALLVVQAILSAVAAPDTYIVNPPNFDRRVDVRGDNLHGISGIQHFTTDARGFRTTKPIDYGDDQTYRIFFVGASTVATR